MKEVPYEYAEKYTKLIIGETDLPPLASDTMRRQVHDAIARMLEKIARRAWEIGDEEIKCHCYRLGLVEKTDALEEWFDNVLNKMMEKSERRSEMK